MRYWRGTRRELKRCTCGWPLDRRGRCLREEEPVREARGRMVAMIFVALGYLLAFALFVAAATLFWLALAATPAHAGDLIAYRTAEGTFLTNGPAPAGAEVLARIEPGEGGREPVPVPSPAPRPGRISAPGRPSLVVPSRSAQDALRLERIESAVLEVTARELRCRRGDLGAYPGVRSREDVRASYGAMTYRIEDSACGQVRSDLEASRARRRALEAVR